MPLHTRFLPPRRIAAKDTVPPPYRRFRGHFPLHYLVRFNIELIGVIDDENEKVVFNELDESNTDRTDTYRDSSVNNFWCIKGDRHKPVIRDCYRTVLEFYFLFRENNSPVRSSKIVLQQS